MKRILLLIFIYLIVLSSSFANDNLISSLKKEDKIIFIRHSLAPGNGDPNNFDIKDCSTQRNLSQNGISQSKTIGLFFSDNKIEIENVFSSEWCRCKDTAKFAFNKFKTFSALNSFYDIRFKDNEEKQIKELNDFIKKWDGNKNIVFVTHFVVISSILNIGTSSGEIVVTDKNLNIIGSINTL